MHATKPLALAAVLLVAGTATADDKPADSRTLRITAQQICPVRGAKLGSQGDPVEVRVGKETVFLCCKGCLKGTISPEHWATIHANYAAAQAKCPVMKKALPKNPKWTIVEGRIVYVCCPPCVDKIEANPQVYLERVDRYYAASLEAERRPSGR